MILRDLQDIGVNITVIPFVQQRIKLINGSLDDPEIFARHSLHVLETLLTVMQSDNKILFVDFFQPLLPLLHYYIDCKEISVKYGALFHGATFIPGDFFAEKLWMKPFEIGFVSLMDSIYVPSQYAAQFFPNVRNNVNVFPYGFCADNYQKNLDPENKYFDVVIPHRWASDKGADFYLEVIIAMPERRFVVSQLGIDSTVPGLGSICRKVKSMKNVIIIGEKSGPSYREALVHSRVVIAANKQELFGYGLREAIASGCIPVCMDWACYPECIPKDHLFASVEEAVELINLYADSYPTTYFSLPNTSFRPILEDFYGS